MFAVVLASGLACAPEPYQPIGPATGPGGVNRRMQLWQIEVPRSPATQPATRPAEAPALVTAAPDTATPQGPVHRLDTANIIQLVYDKSPLVRASRERMVAAQHGLDEFKTNLSRLEPFASVTGNATRFPEQRDSRGTAGELVGGIEKETFEGAVMRVEAGVSASRVRFGEFDEDLGQQEVETGSGGLVRARLEMPFIGSRKRQNRVISQAFQESNARKAKLEYLSDYRKHASNALTYHQYALLYLDYLRDYEEKVGHIEALLDEAGVREEDKPTIQSSLGSMLVVCDRYEAYYRTYLLYLLQYVGINPDEAYILARDDDQQSAYLEQASTEEGRRSLLDEAYINNPRFEVLRDAIADAELQRAQAILGRFDITAFVEGTEFPFGAVTFDDRLGGWQIGAGVAVRLNDHRVLTASRDKAESEIREYRAQIEAEELSVRRQIAMQTQRLVAYADSRAQIRDNLEKATAEFEERRRLYLARDPDVDLNIDDVLSALNTLTSAAIRFSSNRYYIAVADNGLLTATGEVYRAVGLSVDNVSGGAGLAAAR